MRAPKRFVVVLAKGTIQQLSGDFLEIVPCGSFPK